jgi:hypothetical protein
MTEPATDNGELRASTEPALNNARPSQTPTPPPSSLDSLTKGFALTLVFLYVSGFLITSLHNFQYGFSEMNPLRPRILAAGSWFAIFMAIPFALVWQLRESSALKDKSTGLNKYSTLISTYLASGLFFYFISRFLFVFDVDSASKAADNPWWMTALLSVVFLVVLVACRRVNVSEVVII